MIIERREQRFGRRAPDIIDDHLITARPRRRREGLRQRLALQAQIHRGIHAQRLQHAQPTAGGNDAPGSRLTRRRDRQFARGAGSADDQHRFTGLQIRSPAQRQPAAKAGLISAAAVASSTASGTGTVHDATLRSAIAP